MIAIEYFEFTLTEKRQRVIQIEADTRDEAMNIIEQLMQENHDLCILDDADRTSTELVFNDDPVSDMLNTCHDCAEVKLIVLRPGQIASITYARISTGMITSDKMHLRILRIGDDTFLCCGDHGPINRAVRNQDGSVLTILGTAFICRLQGGDTIDVTEDDISTFGSRFLYPVELISIDGFETFSPRIDCGN